MDEKIVAIVRLVAPLIATFAAMLGVSIDADALLVGLFIGAAFITYIWSWWKNNNLTEAAQNAQRYLDELKKESKTTE